MRPRVEIVIDELVLHGFSPADRYTIGDSLSRELEWLVMEQGFQPHESVDVPLLKAAPVNLATNSKPDQVGAHVAQAVYGGLNR
jgi:hypothetical protein